MDVHVRGVIVNWSRSVLPWSRAGDVKLKALQVHTGPGHDNRGVQPIYVAAALQATVLGLRRMSGPPNRDENPDEKSLHA
jgi:hypothetical protein